MTPTQPAASSLPDSIKNLKVTTSANVLDSKFSVSYAGDGDSGKSYCLCSWALSGPDGLVVAVGPGENTETHEKLIRAGFPITLVHIERWSDFAQAFVPAVVNREFKADAIGIEGASFLASQMFREIQGDRNDLDGTDWTLGRNRLLDAYTALRGTTMPKGDAPGYHIIVTTHLKDIMAKGGVRIAVRPAIDGQFKDVFNRLFGTNLLTIQKLEGHVAKVDGRDITIKRKRYLCLTTPPDSQHLCGDKVGGGSEAMPGIPNKFKRPGFTPLPPEVDGTFHGLCAAWGCDPETLKPTTTSK